jgi:hypothetical protein
LQGKLAKAPGDTIVLKTPVGSCVYKVTVEPFVVLPDDWGVVANFGTHKPSQPESLVGQAPPFPSAVHAHVQLLAQTGRTVVPGVDRPTHTSWRVSER